MSQSLKIRFHATPVGGYYRQDGKRSVDKDPGLSAVEVHHNGNEDEDDDVDDDDEDARSNGEDNNDDMEPLQKRSDKMKIVLIR